MQTCKRTQYSALVPRRPASCTYQSQPIKTDPSQSPDEYKYAQDVTAPPDPVAEGTTSDVPIHGEKTNILFHPTPSVSYEPMFAALEKRANILCVGILVATVAVGKIFGGALLGLVPLAMCLSSGVYLWVKEVIRSGREVEWHSEQTRGQMVILPSVACSFRDIDHKRLLQTCFPSPSNG